MGNTRVAAPSKPKIQPAFVVQKLEGKREHVILSYDPKEGRIEKKVQEDAGFLVSFPIKKASMRVRNEAELRRLGFDQTIELINPESDDDEALGYMPNSVTAAVA